VLDIKLIRDNPDAVKGALAKRGQAVPLDELLGWDGERRACIADMNTLQEQRNKASEEVGKLKKQKQEPTAQLLADINAIRDRIKEREQQVAALDGKIGDFLLRVPNLPDDNVPAGKDEKDNKVVRQHGEIPQFDFIPKPTGSWAKSWGSLILTPAAKLSGARFALLKGAGCLLERSLITFMLDTHRAAGFAR